MEAGVLSCPQCGAAVSQDSTQCQYCHALLQTVACPKCMGMMFRGTKFCPHCGAAAQDIQARGATTHHCPRCRTQQLQTLQVANTSLEECPHCGGIWTAAGSFDRICSDAEARTAALGLQLPPPVPLEAHVRYIPCPQCGNLMGRMNYAGRSGIVVNVCRPHGVWLDRDELREIIDYITSGGLDRARQIEIERLESDRRKADHDTGIQAAHDAMYTAMPNALGNDVLALGLLGGLASVVQHFRDK